MLISDQVYLEINFEGKTEPLSTTEFESLVIVQEAGMIVPTFELQLKQNDYSYYEFLVKNNMPIEIILGRDLESAQKYNFIMIDYNYFINNNGLNVVMSGILDVTQFARIPRIHSYEGNSYEVLANIQSLKMDIDYISDDSQYWIQHNISDKKYCENIIRNSYIDEQDFVLSAININGEVTLRSAIKALNEPNNEVNFSTTDGDEETFSMSGFEIGSESGVWAYQFSDNRPQPLLSVKNRGVDKLESTQNSIKTETVYNNFIEKSIQFPTRLDLGNCHDNYYKAETQNLNKETLFFRNKIVTGTSNYFFPTNSLKLLDTIHFTVSKTDGIYGTTTDQLSGRYVLTKNTMSFTASNGFYQSFEMHRDFTLEL